MSGSECRLSVVGTLRNQGFSRDAGVSTRCRGWRFLCTTIDLRVALSIRCGGDLGGALPAAPQTPRQPKLPVFGGVPDELVTSRWTSGTFCRRARARNRMNPPTRTLVDLLFNSAFDAGQINHISYAFSRIARADEDFSATITHCFDTVHYLADCDFNRLDLCSSRQSIMIAQCVQQFQKGFISETDSSKVLKI